jgi:hypothetical protein
MHSRATCHVPQDGYLRTYMKWRTDRHLGQTFLINSFSPIFPH